MKIKLAIGNTKQKILFKAIKIQLNSVLFLIYLRYILAPSSTPGPHSARTHDTKTMIMNEMGSSNTSSIAALNGIPPDVSKIIEQDLAKNPLPSGTERLYRVVINRNLTSPSEDAQVVRVIVKSQGGHNQPVTTGLVSQPRSQSVVVQTTPVIIQPQSPPQQQQQIRYILPPIEQIDEQQQQPHRYTPPPHKSVILPSASATSPTSDDYAPKKSKKRFSFFGN